MGNKYQVYKWGVKDDSYQYMEVYAGDWFICALWFARKAKKNSGCVKIEIRG